LENSNGPFILLTNQLPADNLKTIRKSDTQNNLWKNEPARLDPRTSIWIRQPHCTVLQCHLTKHGINRDVENQKYCKATFLNVRQAFDKVWHRRLLFKIKRILLSSYFNPLNSNFNEHQIEIKFNEETWSQFHIHSGVPQRGTIGALLYLIYTSDLATRRETNLGTFADNTAIFTTHEDPTILSLTLQEQLHITEKWLKWQIKVKESYVYWTVHHLYSCVKRKNQLDATYFII